VAATEQPARDGLGAVRVAGARHQLVRPRHRHQADAGQPQRPGQLHQCAAQRDVRFAVLDQLDGERLEQRRVGGAPVGQGAGLAQAGDDHGGADRDHEVDHEGGDARGRLDRRRVVRLREEEVEREARDRGRRARCDRSRAGRRERRQQHDQRDRGDVRVLAERDQRDDADREQDGERDQAEGLAVSFVHRDRCVAAHGSAATHGPPAAAPTGRRTCARTT
jgi:hypothetical protein